MIHHRREEYNFLEKLDNYLLERSFGGTYGLNKNEIIQNAYGFKVIDMEDRTRDYNEYNLSFTQIIRKVNNFRLRYFISTLPNILTNPFQIQIYLCVLLNSWRNQFTSYHKPFNIDVKTPPKIHYWITLRKLAK